MRTALGPKTKLNQACASPPPPPYPENPKPPTRAAPPPPTRAAPPPNPRYYTEKLSVSPESQEGVVRQIVKDYIRGLCWVMKYYYDGVASWRWWVAPEGVRGGGLGGPVCQPASLPDACLPACINPKTYPPLNLNQGGCNV